MDPSQPAIQKVSIVSGIIPIDNGNDILQFTVIVPPSPAVSPFLSSEPDASVEVDQNPFLPSPLLRATVHEDVVLDNVVSRTPSPTVIRTKKKAKKGKKYFKY
jgi:hypothetical protein